LGKAAGEGRKEEKGTQMSKGDEVDQFAWRKTRTSSSQETEDSNQPDRNEEGFHSIVDLFVSRSKCLRESCMRENRTYSLSGGRWPARKRATSDPTGHVVGKVSEALRNRKVETTDRPSRER
jgi:hypothetical protein